MLLIDLSHTAHTRARTGVQRVCRSLYFASQKQEDVTACTYDPFAKTWRPLRGWENANLASQAPAEQRGAHWPAGGRWRGRFDRMLGRTVDEIAPANGLIVPEIFSPETGRHFSDLFRRVDGPKVAVFHDAIALKFPELTPSKTVARFPGYLQELRQFDGIAAVSEDSRQTLIDYWRWLGLSNAPVVRTISLAAPLPFSSAHFESPANPSTQAGETAPPRTPIILCVGSIEGRKNHISLLDAAEQLWQKGRSFQLHLIGMAHPETGRAALAKIDALQRAGRALRWDGAVPEASLQTAYADCDFTVYPSLMEGFGLPVLESLHYGKPCICSGHGALGEAASGGGCLRTETSSVAALAQSIDHLLTDHASREKLANQAHARPGRSWENYSEELLVFVAELRAKHRPRTT